MRIHFILFLLFASYFQSQAQTSPPIDTTSNSIQTPYTEKQVHSFVNKMPTFRGGGDEAFLKYVSKHLIYPKDALNKKITGTVYVEFTIEKDGSVSNVKIVAGKELYPSLDNEAMRVIRNSPKWKPGKNNGVPVAVKKISKIKFTITDSY